MNKNLLKTRKADLSLQVIIIAVILLIVVVVLIFIFSQKIGLFAGSTSSCKAKGGECGPPDCKNVRVGDKTCGEKFTCIPQPATQCGDKKSPEYGNPGNEYCCKPLEVGEWTGVPPASTASPAQTGASTAPGARPTG